MLTSAGRIHESWPLSKKPIQYFRRLPDVLLRCRVSANRSRLCVRVDPLQQFGADLLDLSADELLGRVVRL